MLVYQRVYGDRSKGPCAWSLNCESRACYVGNPRDVVFFRVRESNIFFRESFAKVGYHDCRT